MAPICPRLLLDIIQQKAGRNPGASLDTSIIFGTAVLYCILLYLLIIQESITGKITIGYELVQNKYRKTKQVIRLNQHIHCLWPYAYYSYMYVFKADIL